MSEGQSKESNLWVQLGMAIVIAIALSLLCIYILQSATLNSVGFALTLTGVIVSLLGFRFTIDQIRKTATATQAASEAVNKLQRNIQNLDALPDIDAALSSSSETQNNLRSKRWTKSRASIGSVRDRLNKINAASLTIDISHREMIKDYCSNVVGISSLIDDVIDKKATADFSNGIQILMNMDIFLLEIKNILKGKINEN